MKKLILLLTVMLMGLPLTAQIVYPAIEELDDDKIVKVLWDTQDVNEEWNEQGKHRDVIELGQATLDWYDALPEEFLDEDDYPWGIYLQMTEAAAKLGEVEEALDYIKRALDRGCNNLIYLDTDEDLEEVRKHERFTEMTSGLRQKMDFIGHLKRSAPYQAADTAELPRFMYAEPSTLRWVHNYFQLDTVAGDGNEIERIKRVMTWVHDNIEHDGGNPGVSEPNAIDIYNYHKASGKGVNCRRLATVLNEFYLALGFKSRFVTCLPMDENDGDCHVINMVYSDSLQKWLWMDPSFNAYVMDEDGNLLSIEEVRYRLINDLPLLLNPDANWNNRRPYTKEYYIDTYMAKNLYWLECPVYSRYNLESSVRSGKNYINLKPPGYERSGIKNAYIDIHDPEYFWQKP